MRNNQMTASLWTRTNQTKSSEGTLAIEDGHIISRVVAAGERRCPLLSIRICEFVIIFRSVYRHPSEGEAEVEQM